MSRFSLRLGLVSNAGRGPTIPEFRPKNLAVNLVCARAGHSCSLLAWTCLAWPGNLSVPGTPSQRSGLLLRGPGEGPVRRGPGPPVRAHTPARKPGIYREQFLPAPSPRGVWWWRCRLSDIPSSTRSLTRGFSVCNPHGMRPLHVMAE